MTLEEVEKISSTNGSQLWQNKNGESRTVAEIGAGLGKDPRPQRWGVRDLKSFVLKGHWCMEIFYESVVSSHLENSDGQYEGMAGLD